ncbi:MAG: universal stress protein [Mycobacterium sp.]|uniref:universal stress protein n=1 Tax=Mycobacterium sp. TaxID=1785 RepID=UPI003C511440
MTGAESPGPVVVAVDGSKAAIGAAEWAAKEAVHHDVPLRLVYVIQVADRPTSSADAASAREDYAESSLRAARLAVEATGLPVKIDTAVLYGDADSALIAESGNATLICVGSVGIGRVANMVLGSTAVILAEEAHCPVAIIRREGNSPPLESGFVAVVVDDQPDNDEVMYWALEEARVRRAPVLALGVWRWALFENSHEEFYRRLDNWLGRYPDVQVEIATTRLSVTRYLEAMVGAVQLVVIGSEDANRVVQLVGPHGLPILAHADCSVLVVRGTNH